MIEKYKIKKINDEDILFIYLDYNYEFSKIGNDNKSQKILDQIKNTLHNIKFNGQKIVVMVGAIAIAVLLFNGNDFKGSIVEEKNTTHLTSGILTSIDYSDNLIIDTSKENYIIETQNINIPVDNLNQIEIKEKNDNYSVDNSVSTNYSNINEVKNENNSVDNSIKTSESSNIENIPVETSKETYVTIYRSNGTILQIALEEYLIGVVAAEMPASFNMEALKAQAVVARTYALKRVNENLVLTDTVSTQEYKDISQMQTMWQNDFQKYFDKIKTAVELTKGKYITYNNSYIDAVYHSTSNGYTEDPMYVWGYQIPYLKSVDSHWDTTASSYLRTETKEYNLILSILGINIDINTEIEILNKNETNRITSIKIGDKTYNGVEFRNLLGLRSTDFDVSIENQNLVFTTRGYGHGVGMSQYGANGMAKEGYNYEQILNHYYQNITING
ncbi:MAG: stage II sporulation protein D [Bacilli bacterium]|nr:stage II sporulation protein D [Bacilli bacterium]